MPAIFDWDVFVQEDGLMSYELDYKMCCVARRAMWTAFYVAPSPPSCRCKFRRRKWELFINRKTANRERTWPRHAGNAVRHC